MIVAETERLLISKFTIEDAPFYLELVNTPNWLKYIGDRNIKTLEDAEDRIKTTILTSYETLGYGAYKLQLKDDNLIIIGSCGLYKRAIFDYADIGFAMLPAYEGKGYGYESSVEMLRLAEHVFNQKKVGAITLPTNKPSIKLLEILGLKHQKTAVFFDDDEELMLFAKTF